jgi:hypothetical protein
MAPIRERPITLAPWAPYATLRLNDRTAILHLPRRVIRHAASTALRFYDMELSDDPSHAKDVVVYG